MPFWFPTTQQHQRFLPTLPGTGKINATADTTEMKVFKWLPTLCFCGRTWTEGFLQACSQQALCLGQLKPVLHSPCCKQSDSKAPPPLIWTAATQWWSFRIQWKTHWLKEILARENAWVYPGKGLCSEYCFLLSGLFKSVAAITHKIDIFRTATQSVIHHCCHQLLPDELCILEKPPLLLMSEHIAWVRPIHLHSDDVFHTLY